MVECDVDIGAIDRDVATIGYQERHSIGVLLQRITGSANYQCRALNVRKIGFALCVLLVTGPMRERLASPGIQVLDN